MSKNFFFRQTNKARKEQRERGQSIVLIAAAMVGLLAFVGIAVDVGFVFARSTQLQAAVDSAALAGVTELASGDINLADAAARKFLNANRLPISSTLTLQSSSRQTILQETEYMVTVTWPLELFFLKVIGWETIDIEKSAAAAFFPLADIYASRRVEDGALSTSNQAVFGPHICTGYGDPYSPFNSTHRPLGYPSGSYTYRYRILIPPSYPYDTIRVELFDPDSHNRATNTATIARTVFATNPPPPASPLPPTTTRTCNGGSGDQRNACLLSTGEEVFVSGPPYVDIDQINPFWFMRIDENRGTGGAPGNGACGQPTGYDSAYNTETMFSLYYFARNPDGSVQEILLANYKGQKNNIHGTDLRWVSPGSPLSYDQTVNVPIDPSTPGVDFEINLNTETPNILTEAGTGNRYLYIGVTSLIGASENGYEIWAGPPTYINSSPSDVNARNIYVLDNPGGHSSQGATVFAIGNLPMNSNYQNRVDIPLIYVGPEYAGQSVYISLFDSDVDIQPPITFFFDSLARVDWEKPFSTGGTDPDGVPNGERCRPQDGGQPTGCNDKWILPRYEITVPGDLDNCDWQNPDPDNCTPFYGGRLTASYDGGFADTYVWQVSLQGEPFLTR